MSSGGSLANELYIDIKCLCFVTITEKLDVPHGICSFVHWRHVRNERANHGIRT